MCYVSKLLGDACKKATLELNASDERGIDVIREKVKLFASTKITLPPGKHKYVILDEADSLTPSAQQALRRIMEIYSESTRFALTCNDSTKIIEPIQSRCAMIRFKLLEDKDILRCLMRIIESEKIKYTDDGLEAIVSNSQGDMRQAINSLQATHTTFQVVNAENIYRLSDEPHPLMIENMLSKCIDGDYFGAYLILSKILEMGFMVEDLIGTITRGIQQMKQAEYVVLECLKLSADTHLRISKGSGSKLQLTRLLSSIYLLCQNKK